eukprot:SAG31_NODE_3709_length_3967_cov_8.847983_3_plen_120_part_00
MATFTVVLMHASRTPADDLAPVAKCLAVTGVFFAVLFALATADKSMSFTDSGGRVSQPHRAQFSMWTRAVQGFGSCLVLLHLQQRDKDRATWVLKMLVEVALVLLTRPLVVLLYKWFYL